MFDTLCRRYVSVASTVGCQLLPSGGQDSRPHKRLTKGRRWKPFALYFIICFLKDQRVSHDQWFIWSSCLPDALVWHAVLLSHCPSLLHLWSNASIVTDVQRSKTDSVPAHLHADMLGDQWAISALFEHLVVPIWIPKFVRRTPTSRKSAF